MLIVQINKGFKLKKSYINRCAPALEVTLNAALDDLLKMIHVINIESNVARYLFTVAKMTCLSTNEVVHSQREFDKTGSYLNDAEVMKPQNSIYEADKLDNYVKERDYF